MTNSNKFYALNKKFVDDKNCPIKELPSYFFVWSDDFPNIFFGECEAS
jgi:hypothetical protein